MVATARLLLALSLTIAIWAQNRIVSTSPAITETLFAVGLGTKVVGVSKYCNYPQEATTRTRIGTYLRPNVEAIVRLKPDLAIVERLPNNALDQLKSAGVPVHAIAPGNLESNLKMMTEIATVAGAPDKGKALTDRTRTELNKIQKQTATTKRVKAIFIVGRTPGELAGIVAVGKGSYLNEIIGIAGGINLLADTPVAYPKLSLESVIRLRPDVIIDMGDMAETQGVSNEHKQAVRKMWKQHPEIKSRVYAVADDIFVVPGPRMVDAARAFQRMFTAQE